MRSPRINPVRCSWPVLAAAACCAALPALAAAQPGYDVNPQTLQRFFGRTHAMLVHFPIAMVIVAATLEVLAALKGRLNPSRPAAMSHAGLACLSFGALGAVAASFAGWVNAANEGVGSADQSTLFWHRWLGVSVAAIAAIAVVIGLVARQPSGRLLLSVYRAALVLAALVVGFTGHLGGSMVYGDGYLIAAFEVRRPAPDPGRPDATPSVLASAQPPSAMPAAMDPALESKVKAILDRSCVECHGPRKQKGDLRLDSLADLASHEVVRAGDPDASEIIRRVLLPEDDDDFMPKDDPPLAPAEIDALRSWVAALAGRAVEPSVVATDRPAAPTASTSSAAPAVHPLPDVRVVLTDEQRTARQRAIDAIRSAGGYAAPISSASDLVHVNFAMLGKTCGDQTLELLSGLEPVLVEINLSGTGVSDKGAKDLQRFTMLERINLGRTALTDTGVAHLAVLPRLVLLNLHNTAVTDSAVDAMSAMPSLRRAYVWRTSMTPEGISRLAAGRSGLTIDHGAPPAPSPAAVAATDPAAPAPAAATSAEEPAASPPATVAAAKPACCAKAESQGRQCDHPCCVKARADGHVCQKCLGN